MNFKIITRDIIRKILDAKEFETIGNALERKKLKLEKVFKKKKISKDDLKRALKESGIKTGMDILVHASWRQFYNFEGSPEDVISILEETVGKDGTILMPSYGKRRDFFDVNNTPSNAGVISEIFRNQSQTLRSACTHFSIAARGKNAEYLTKSHFYSHYGFDKNSPMYLLSQINNSKIIFLGLSREPTTISLFHCAGYILKNNSMFLKHKIFIKKMNTKLIIDGEIIEKDMLTRNPDYKNNTKVFKTIFKDLKSKQQIKISNLDIVTINAKEGLDKAIEYGEKGKYCYKFNRLS